MAHTILEKIIQTKWQEIEAAQRQISLAHIKARAEDFTEKTRGFTQALLERRKLTRPGIIAEIKKASPSKGLIRPDFDVAAIAHSYEKGGATCLSVLTDVHYFQGSPAYLKIAREQTNLPVIRKDFIVDAYQVYEARLMGADALLLIVAALTDEKLTELYELSLSLGVDVLVEVHNATELERALKLDLPLVGINNRNLHTFEVSLDTTLDLLAQIPPEVMVITESGILTQEDVKRMLSAGVYGFLIGESFMRQADPGAYLAQIFGNN